MHHGQRCLAFAFLAVVLVACAPARTPTLLCKEAPGALEYLTQLAALEAELFNVWYPQDEWDPQGTPQVEALGANIPRMKDIRQRFANLEYPACMWRVHEAALVYIDTHLAYAQAYLENRPAAEMLVLRGKYQAVMEASDLELQYLVDGIEPYGPKPRPTRGIP